MICIVESTIESLQNKNTKIKTNITHNLYNHYIQFSDYFNKIFKLITTYSMLYGTCNYHILYYSKLINVHPITTVLIVNLTSKRMNSSCALL